MQEVLGAAIASALGAVASGCGTQPVACGGCGCNGYEAAAPVQYDVTYDVCAASDAGTADADVDASTDASVSDASTPEAGACYATCEEACVSLKPATITGIGSCISPDAGATSGTVTVHCQTLQQACAGRKLDGLEAPAIACDTELGAFFAEMAWLEAASVGAFRRLARELRAHGAPEHLVEEAKASARDEIRHARVMARLAKKHGAEVPGVVVERIDVRDLESVARENAVEGCVGETYGAAVARWHADYAADADVRDAMRAIADDELRHAALGWAVAAWADARLDEAARKRVRAARDEAARALAVDNALAAELERNLWAA